MAEILQGNTQHCSVAPLSQAQTVQLAQHLQLEIRNVENTLNGVARDVQHTQENVQNLREKATQSHDDVHNLQVGLANTNANLEKVSKELGRVSAATQQLQISDKHTKDKITLLEEAQKMQETRTDVVVRDVKICRETVKNVKDLVERNVSEDLRALRNELANTNHTCNGLNGEIRQMAIFEKENRDALRDARVDVENVSSEVKKTNTMANILENRVATAARGLNQVWSKCGEISDTMVKLTDCYEQTKSRVFDVEVFIKEVEKASKKTHEEVEQAVLQIEHNTDRLTQALKRIDDEGASANEMQHHINALRQGQGNAARNLTTMKNELKEVSQLAMSVKAGLKEQSSMLLPNIHMDSPEALAASQRHGTMLVPSSPTGSPNRQTARGTPRGKEAGGGAMKAWS